MSIWYPNLGYRSNQKKITWSNVRADHMIRSHCIIRVICFSLKMEIAKATSKILPLSILNCYCCRGAKCTHCSLRIWIYKYSDPRFTSCVTLREDSLSCGNPLFDCSVKIRNIEWQNNRPIIRYRYTLLYG